MSSKKRPAIESDDDDFDFTLENVEDPVPAPKAKVAKSSAKAAAKPKADKEKKKSAPAARKKKTIVIPEPQPLPDNVPVEELFPTEEERLQLDKMTHLDREMAIAERYEALAEKRREEILEYQLKKTRGEHIIVVEEEGAEDEPSGKKASKGSQKKKGGRKVVDEEEEEEEDDEDALENEVDEDEAEEVSEDEYVDEEILPRKAKGRTSARQRSRRTLDADDSDQDARMRGDEEGDRDEDEYDRYDRDSEEEGGAYGTAPYGSVTGAMPGHEKFHYEFTYQDAIALQLTRGELFALRRTKYMTARHLEGFFVRYAFKREDNRPDYAMARIVDVVSSSNANANSNPASGDRNSREGLVDALKVVVGTHDHVVTLEHVSNHKASMHEYRVWRRNAPDGSEPRYAEVAEKKKLREEMVQIIEHQRTEGTSGGAAPAAQRVELDWKAERIRLLVALQSVRERGEPRAVCEQLEQEIRRVEARIAERESGRQSAAKAAGGSRAAGLLLQKATMEMLAQIGNRPVSSKAKATGLDLAQEFQSYKTTFDLTRLG